MPQVLSREEVQKLLSALLIARKEAHTTGVTLDRLNSDYWEQAGTCIPFREHGHTSLLEFLQSLSGGLFVRYKNGMHYAFPVVSEKTKHVSSLVVCQNSKGISRGSRKFFPPSRFYPSVSQPRLKLNGEILLSIVKLAQNSPAGVHINRVVEYVRDRINYNLNENDLRRQLRDISHEVSIENDILYSASTPQQKRRQNQETHVKSQNDVAPTGTRDNKSCNIRAAGSSSDEFNDYDVDFVSDVADAKNDVSRGMERLNANEKIHENDHVAETMKTIDADCDYDAAGDHDSIDILINERMRIRLEKLILKYPEGIWCAELPDLYKKEYTISLNYEELGFHSVIEFASHLPQIFHHTQPQDRGDFKLFHAKASIPNIKQGERRKVQSLAALHNLYEQYEGPIEPIPTVLSQAILDRLVPEGVMTLDETVEQICVTTLNRGVNGFINVVVVDVFTPSYFWIQLLSRIPRFKVFMDDLHAFYEKHSKRYVVPTAVMKKGMNCACMYENVWHRGIIKTVGFDNHVTVMFYDYGTIKTYPPECIHFLHRRFANLPAQAIPCGLYNVKPVEGNRWVRHVSYEFVSRVTNVPLVATIASIDTDNNSMLIGLTNTQGPEDFHINDWLVHSGFAMYGQMVCIKPPNYPYQRYLECNCVGSSDMGTSTKSKNVNLERNNVVDLTSLRDDSYIGHYNILKNLHLKSKAGENSSKLPTTRRENKRFFNNIKSQTDKDREPEVVEYNCMTNEARTRRAMDGSTDSGGKAYGVKIPSEMCEAYSRQNNTGSVSNTDSNLDERRDDYIFASDTMSSLLNIDIRKNEIIGNENDIDQKLISDKDEIFDETKLCNEGEIFIVTRQTVPLHLSEITRKNGKLSEFGTLRSRFGGQGRMESINWSDIRNNVKFEEKTSNLSIKSNLPSTMKQQLHYDFPEPARTQQDLRDLVNTDRVKENVEFEKHDICKKNVNVNIINEREKSYDVIEESTNKVCTLNCPKFPKHKRALWNIVKSSTEKQNSEIDEVPRDNASAQFKETIENNTVNTIESSMEKTPETILKTGEKSISDGKTDIPEFGKFHSIGGTGGRPESVRWTELKALIETKKKTAEVSTQTHLPSENSETGKIPLNLPKANKIFLKIINDVRSGATNRDATCVPEGNIVMGSNLKNSTRTLLKRVEQERNERLNLFIPKSILEIMRNADSDENSTSEPAQSSNESEIIDKSKLHDPFKENYFKSMKTIDSATKISSESLSEMSGSTISQRQSLAGSTDGDIQRDGEFSENSSICQHEILQFSPPGKATDRIIGKSSSPFEKSCIPNNQNFVIDNKSSRPSGKNSRQMENKSCPTKVTNASLQSIRLKPSNKQLSKLIDSHLDSTNNSELDSDDFSIIEEVKDDKDKMFDDDGYPMSSKSNFQSRISREIEENVSMDTPKTLNVQKTIEKECKDDDSLALNIDVTKTVNEKPRINDNNDESIPDTNKHEKYFNGSQSVSSEPSKTPLSKIDEAAAKLMTNCRIVDDRNMKSDDDEWDYSSGWFEDQIIENYKQGIVIAEPLTTNNPIAIEKNRLKTIFSDDESSLEISEKVEDDTSPNESSRHETDSDSEPIENKYHLIDDESGNANSTSPSNSANTKRSSNDHDSSRSLNFPNDKEQLINPDDRDNSHDDSLYFGNVDKIKKSPIKPCLISSEIRKSNILKATNNFANLDGSSSSSGEKFGNTSYKRSFISAVKRYF